MPHPRASHAFAAFVALSLLTACSSAPPPIAVAPGQDTVGTLVLRPGDVVKVDVFGHDELSGEYPVDENFNLLLPIIGEFSVRGMSVAELRARIRRDFGQLYTQSFVSVVPMFRVAVLGEVVRPGLYSVDPTMTVFDVLALAGGTNRDAKGNQIHLVRSGQQVRLGLDAEYLGRATIRELGVRSGDQLFIPRKFITEATAIIGLQLVNTLLLAYTIFR